MEISTRRRSTLRKNGLNWVIHRSRILLLGGIVKIFPIPTLSNAWTLVVHLHQHQVHHHQVQLRQVQLHQVRSRRHHRAPALHQARRLHQTSLQPLARNVSSIIARTSTKLPARRARIASRLNKALAPRPAHPLLSQRPCLGSAMLLRPCWFEQHESGLLPPNFGAKYAVKQRRTTSVTYLVYHFLVNQLGGGQVSWQAWLATPRTLFTF